MQQYAKTVLVERPLSSLLGGDIITGEDDHLFSVIRGKTPKVTRGHCSTWNAPPPRFFEFAT